MKFQLLLCQNQNQNKKSSLFYKRKKKTMQKITFEIIDKQLIQLKLQLINILVDKNLSIPSSHRIVRQSIFNFVNGNPKPTILQKVEINHRVRKNIQEFIQIYIEPKIKYILEINDSYLFVQIISQVWENYQRFVFAHNWVVDKLSTFYQNFHKLNNAKDFSYKGQVVSVSIIAVNQLKKFYQKTNILQVYPKIFSSFIAKERQGINVPRQLIHQTINAIQSSFYDFEALIKLDINQKPCIVKNQKCLGLITLRRSKASDYFQKNIMSAVFSDCQSFYTKFIKQKLLISSATDQMDLMLKILNEEQQRSNFYLNTIQNQKKYLQFVEKILIGLNLQERIKKNDGLIKFLKEYQTDKPQFASQLTKFWKIYSKIDKSLPLIIQVYDQYLQEQAIIVEQKIDKFMQFTPEMIKINMKNLKIMQFFENNFEIQKKKNIKIRGMLSNQIVKNSKFSTNHSLGANNLAQYINLKFKQIYGKGLQDQKQFIFSIQQLFKILQQKVYFTKQHEKFIANRLLQDIDFNKDNQYINIINLEKGFIEQMQKQIGVSQVKELLQNIKDIQKSLDFTKKIKQKIGPQIHILNQIIIKNNTFWPEKFSYQITAPNCLFRIANIVQNYFSNISSNIQFQYQNGVSTFKGQFTGTSKTQKQIFQLKNIYMLILLLLDETPGKKLFYADIKSKIKSYGRRKLKGNLQLSINIIQLLHSGLIISNTKKILKEDPKCFKIQQSDQFQLNTQFDYEREMHKNKVPAKMIKKLPIIKTINIQRIPQWLKKMKVQAANELAQDQITAQKQRRFRVKQIAVKTLKHAHHSNKNCTFEQLVQQYSKKDYRQFKVTEKYLKQVLQELINDQYCQRVDDQRNVFKYKA